MKLATYQGSSTLFEISKNLELLTQIADAATQQGADFLVLPELFLTGYNLGEAIREVAEPYQGESLQEAATIARQHRLALLVSYVEQENEEFYNATALIDADGNFLGNYRKTHLFGAEERRLFKPGHQWVIQSIAGIQVGILICFDVEFPEAVRSLAMRGAELIAVPAANMFPYTQIPDLVVPTRALENQVFLTYVNRVGTEGNFTYCGLSSIVAPSGRAIARAGLEEETLLVAEINRDAIDLERRAYCYLKESRFELY